MKPNNLYRRTATKCFFNDSLLLETMLQGKAPTCRLELCGNLAILYGDCDSVHQRSPGIERNYKAIIIIRINA